MDSHPRHGALTGSPLDRLDDRTAQTELVHGGHPSFVATISTRTTTSGSTRSIEDPRWLHPEVADVERRPTLEPDRAIVDGRDAHLVLARPAHPSERHITADRVAAIGPDWFHAGEHSVDRGIAPGCRRACAARDPRTGCPTTSGRPAGLSLPAGFSPTCTSAAPSASAPILPSRSMKPSRPSVVEWIGCTFDRASIQTRDRSGTMWYRVMAPTSSAAARVTAMSHLPDLEVPGEVRDRLHDHHGDQRQE